MPSLTFFSLNFLLFRPHSPLKSWATTYFDTNEHSIFIALYINKNDYLMLNLYWGEEPSYFLSLHLREVGLEVYAKERSKKRLIHFYTVTFTS